MFQNRSQQRIITNLLLICYEGPRRDSLSRLMDPDTCQRWFRQPRGGVNAASPRILAADHRMSRVRDGT
jgi:hypothetical protein